MPGPERWLRILSLCAVLCSSGAVARAQANLQKLQRICGAKSCPQVASLSAAISRGPTVASAKAPETPKQN